MFCFPSGVSPVTPSRAGIKASGVTENSSIPASTSHFANSGLVEGRLPQRPKWNSGFVVFLSWMRFYIMDCRCCICKGRISPPERSNPNSSCKRSLDPI